VPTLLQLPGPQTLSQLIQTPPPLPQAVPDVPGKQVLPAQQPVEQGFPVPGPQVAVTHAPATQVAVGIAPP
jgi:hypothetical protein